MCRNRVRSKLCLKMCLGRDVVSLRTTYRAGARKFAPSPTEVDMRLIRAQADRCLTDVGPLPYRARIFFSVPGTVRREINSAAAKRDRRSRTESADGAKATLL